MATYQISINEKMLLGRNILALLQSIPQVISFQMPVVKALPKKKDDTLYSKEAYFAMLDESLKQYEQGEYTTVKNKQELKPFLQAL